MSMQTSLAAAAADPAGAPAAHGGDVLTLTLPARKAASHALALLQAHVLADEAEGLVRHFAVVAPQDASVITITL